MSASLLLFQFCKAFKFLKHADRIINGGGRLPKALVIINLFVGLLFFLNWTVFIDLDILTWFDWTYNVGYVTVDINQIILLRFRYVQV